MRKKAIILLVMLAVLIFAGVLLSLVRANHREIRILSVHIGSNRFEVEHYLGEGRVCHSYGSKEDWWVYDGNPSLWFGRFEDSIEICYSNNVVIKTGRIGL
ncbi:hypothetical protein P4C99_12605 [Pontiellaceae bacterium B1224]|nr:hypothetical protein [Pontiellaceae bacterium B1224]